RHRDRNRKRGGRPIDQPQHPEANAPGESPRKKNPGNIPGQLALNIALLPVQERKHRRRVERGVAINRIRHGAFFLSGHAERTNGRMSAGALVNRFTTQWATMSGMSRPWPRKMSAEPTPHTKKATHSTSMPGRV